MIAYWTAYLKAHYPEAFMAALMTSDADDMDRLAIEINECRHMGIEVLLPDVNESYVEFAVVPGKNQIRFGMSAIKNVGVGAVEEIIRARDEGGRFKDIVDFLERVDTRKVNRKVWESLIKSGGFDDMGYSRGDLMFNLEGLLAIGSKFHKEKDTNQADLFSGADGSVPKVTLEFKIVAAPEQFKEHDMLLFERELLGLYLSRHPLDGYLEYLAENTLSIADITNKIDNKAVTIGGVVTSIRSITTKNGARMAFVKLEDKTAECELIVFPGVYEKLNLVWQQDKVVIAKGKVNYKDRDGNLGMELKILVDQANLVSEEDAKAYQPTGKKAKVPKQSKLVKPKKPGAGLPPLGGNISQTPSTEAKLYVKLSDPTDNEKLIALKEISNQFPGTSELILVLGENSAKTAIRMPFKVDTKDELIRKLGEVFDKNKVALK